MRDAPVTAILPAVDIERAKVNRRNTENPVLKVTLLLNSTLIVLGNAQLTPLLDCLNTLGIARGSIFDKLKELGWADASDLPESSPSRVDI